MKKEFLILAVLMLSLSTIANEANKVHKEEKRQNKEQQAKKGEKGHRSHRREDMEQKSYAFMQKFLKEIGVSEEDKAKIKKLQSEHRKKLQQVRQKMKEARKELSDLQNSDVSEEELNIAIDKISKRQTELLRATVMNRREMENILGKDNYKKFMNYARKEFHKHRKSKGKQPEKTTANQKQVK